MRFLKRTETSGAGDSMPREIRPEPVKRGDRRVLRATTPPSYALGVSSRRAKIAFEGLSPLLADPEKLESHPLPRILSDP